MNKTYNSNQAESLNENDDIKIKIKKAQDETLESSRRAIERLNLAQGAAAQNMSTLANQSEQLDRAEKKIGITDAQLKVSQAKVDHLKAVNRCFLIPTCSGGAKRRKEKYAKQVQLQKAIDLREGTAQSMDPSSYRGKKTTFNTTPEGLERDQTEEEIDSNLGQISSGVSALKMMSNAMSAEMDKQNAQIQRIDNHADESRARLKKINADVRGIID
jgi:hypothetical protein